MSGGYGSIQDATSLLTARGTLASLSLASKYLADYHPTTGPAGLLTRTTSGILFFDDFVRSDRALNGDNGWVDDANTWSIVSNVATSSGQNFARCRNTGMTPVAAAIWEARVQSPSGGIYSMLRLLAPSSSDDYHLDLKGDNSDKRLSRAASTDTTIATLTCTMNTSYHVIKVRYSGTRDFVVWFDHAAGVLGSLGTPFTSGAGPTAAGVVGMMGYGGAPLFDWVLVSSSHILTVTGLSGTQAFRLFASGGGTIGSSGAQTAGSATLDLSTLVDGLTTGYIEVHPSTAFASMQARYPAVSGDATDIAGGDSYAFS